VNRVEPTKSVPGIWQVARSIIQSRLDAIARNVNQLEWVTVKKDADETVSSDSTYSDDADLTFPAAASSKYAFRIVVFFDTSAAADFKYQIQGPASPTLVRMEVKHIIAGGTAYAGQVVQTAFATSVAVAGGGTTGGFVEVNGILHNGTTADEVVFQWAQNTSDASNTTVRAGSYLEWMPL
jgi:hypothetical protein